MATTTTTVTQQQLNDGKPKDHHRNTAKARYIGPPPIDVDGKTIPHSKRWGFSTNAFDNGELKSTAFVIAMMTALTAFNQTQIAHQFFDYLDKNFTSFQINFFGTYLITFTWYWFIAGLFAFVDLTGKPRFLFKYKVQPFQRVDGKEYLHIAKIALRNFTVVVIPLVYLRSTLTPAKVSSKYVEGPWETMFNLIFNLICTEIGFYFIHRFFHSSFMYKRFHKQHHYMTAPVALASTYCTMTEHVFSNLLPNAIGTAIMKPHWSVQIYTFIILSTTTLCAHSGFNIPFLYSSLQHDFHHFAFNENFGPSGLIDGLLGTNKTFKLAINDGMKRNQGSRDKAREELLSKLAAWEANQDDEKKAK